MLRVRDLNSALTFYVDRLGMTVMRQQEFPEGRFTLAFVGYLSEHETSVIELTYNWDDRPYVLGSAFGHLAIEVDDVEAAINDLAGSGVTVTRQPGPLTGDPSQFIAFVTDPDGYAIELIQSQT